METNVQSNPNETPLLPDARAESAHPVSHAASADSLQTARSAFPEVAGSSVDIPIKTLSSNGKRIGRPPTHGGYVGGKDPRRGKIPAQKVAGVSASPLLEETQTDLLPLDTPSGPAPFNRAVAEAAAPQINDLILSVYKEFQRFRVARSTKNQELADFISSKIDMDGKTKTLADSSLVQLAEKHHWDLSKFPEYTYAGCWVLFGVKTENAIRSGIREFMELMAKKSAA